MNEPVTRPKVNASFLASSLNISKLRRIDSLWLSMAMLLFIASRKCSIKQLLQFSELSTHSIFFNSD